jgi:hypothetical protein
MGVPRVGERDDEALVFELCLEEWVDTIKPEDYDLPPDTLAIDPKSCFVTSGDAVQKAKHLVKSITRVVDQLDRSAYKRALANTVKQAARLVRKLDEIKGENVFLETEFDSAHRLLVIPKNPRSKGA